MDTTDLASLTQILTSSPFFAAISASLEGLSTPIASMTAISSNVYFGPGDDVIELGNTNNTIYAGNGNNVVLTGLGADLIYAGSGRDLNNLISAPLTYNGAVVTLTNAVSINNFGDIVATGTYIYKDANTNLDVVATRSFVLKAIV